MDYPYDCVRTDPRGRVSLAQFRYLGDALGFVKGQLAREVNDCAWTVWNRESGRLCLKARLAGGEVTYPTDEEHDR